MRLEEEGATIVVCGSHDPRTKYTGKYGYPLLSNEQIDAAWIGCYQCGVAMEKIDAVIVPGGFAPDYMRRNQWMLDLVVFACERNIPVAAICHGPWLLCSARPTEGGPPVLSGRRATCFSAIKDDVINAGATYVDDPVVVDGNLITSRTPADLILFVQTIITEVLMRNSSGS
eukprot:CAMPEP_0181249782 /NCGR_PEP_ID=MMETSP1096-20121128/45957_1 /TAXON_ID=156174 ORGANISM="Chrysochromulina ericina, Strain CCMP281" /NCGR_SAMPLE_ID=MMETSP1096 /ASSEMBLY_ACC=CAM_ASM_000453 /LENGTH=171 /DNA_ID=CAMNT_0023347181 /DNA_START=99 /DNA_END=614 /DNA_ORIENTATION=+